MPMLAVAESAPAESSALDKVLNVTAQSDVPDDVSQARAAILRQMGEGLGKRAGLLDESKKIVAEIETQKSDLDRKFSFGSLTFSNGALPPVIEKPEDILAVTDYSMTVAGVIYRIVSPARFVQINWRDYLYIGLTTGADDPIVNDEQKKEYPRNSAEQRYWKKVVTESYEKGRAEAKKIYDLNLARLLRDFNGMQMYYELYARGLVSAPMFASATESVSRPDPNTIVIGQSLFRITNQPTFEANAHQWKAKK
jgi:defect-in-organelle-trafficking protein DotC